MDTLEMAQEIADMLRVEIKEQGLSGHEAVSYIDGVMEELVDCVDSLLREYRKD